jgi:hypothetical protein
MPESNAAIWSAVAASFAALSSFLTMRIQRRNLLESIRPELVLIGWERWTENGEGTGTDILRFRTIKNVGRGVAYHIYMSQGGKVVIPLAAGLLATRVPVILGANEPAEIDGQIMLWWENVKLNELGLRETYIIARIFCMDSCGVRYETQYNLLAAELSSIPLVMSNEIAPRVALLGRRTTTQSLRWFCLKGKARHVSARLLEEASRIRKKATLLG